ncbi:2-hydroxymuconate semialdehyde hydrolase [Thalassovita autumnalis]|uniref:2-hydroxymuconate semialdehyde hydrolase n=1 Tax=Thalassovita autumnalis TaxID=2072972 RepID=A0A0P1G9Z9_9RHOB|nr:alpha/beta hydrolase [Thalassovita autumnalis]CUH66067.1 2-hydroxymuconate semialdehyde hydrolase [Thalassovita autumnalis]CUH72486.1 2-hydroxymuconate semialdehyde hydrolase [Thalassovita autumnalis]
MTDALTTLLVLLTGLGGWTHIRASAAELQAEKDFPPEGEFIDVDGRKVHVVVKGESGPDVVLIHGLSGNSRDFTHSLADRLASSYRVLVMDRPGMGYTDILPSDNSIVEQARVLKKAAGALGAHLPIVVGQSYGGSVALAWAARFPNRLAALVTLGAPAYPFDPGMPLHYWLNSNPVLSQFSAPLITAFLPDSKVQSELAEVFAPQRPPLGYGSHIGAPLTLRRKCLRTNALHRANLVRELAALEPLYASITTPTEIIHGEADRTVSVDIHAMPLAKKIVDSNLTLLRGIGHMPHHVAREDVMRIIHRAAHRAGLR